MRLLPAVALGAAADALVVLLLGSVWLRLWASDTGAVWSGVAAALAAACSLGALMAAGPSVASALRGSDPAPAVLPLYAASRVTLGVTIALLGGGYAMGEYAMFVGFGAQQLADSWMQVAVGYAVIGAVVVAQAMAIAFAAGRWPGRKWLAVVCCAPAFPLGSALAVVAAVSGRPSS